ncbi:helix-turn-helix domain-containing protein [Myxococcus fulvus]|uniref:helix-turn-helix domain-containing protein n=1 Tax=Myxococcus fulvus TaxID=33 RepID=UPI003144FE1F
MAISRSTSSTTSCRGSRWSPPPASERTSSAPTRARSSRPASLLSPSDRRSGPGSAGASGPQSPKRKRAGDPEGSPARQIMVGETGFEPATPWSRTKAKGRPGVISGSQTLVNTRVSSSQAVQPSHPVGQDTKIFAAGLLLGSSTPVPSMASGSGRLLTVREAAERLGVCRATVYRLCERGELPHVRISNAVRVEAEALEKFIREPSSQSPMCDIAHHDPTPGPDCSVSAGKSSDFLNRRPMLGAAGRSTGAARG